MIGSYEQQNTFNKLRQFMSLLSSLNAWSFFSLEKEEMKKENTFTSFVAIKLRRRRRK